MYWLNLPIAWMTNILGLFLPYNKEVWIKLEISNFVQNIKFSSIQKQSHSSYLKFHSPHVAIGEWVGQRWFNVCMHRGKNNSNCCRLMWSLQAKRDNNNRMITKAAFLLSVRVYWSGNIRIISLILLSSDIQLRVRHGYCSYIAS